VKPSVAFVYRPPSAAPADDVAAAVDAVTVGGVLVVTGVVVAVGEAEARAGCPAGERGKATTASAATIANPSRTMTVIRRLDASVMNESAATCPPRQVTATERAPGG
jgi:hypothetical protein